MTMFETTIDSWKAELDTMEDACPWTGPRPYSHQLDNPKRPFTGRNSEIVDVITQIRDNSLVILHGESAVGKTSFVTMGLRPAMQRYGFVPLICSSWTTSIDFTFSESEDMAAPRDLAGVDAYLRDVILENVRLTEAVRNDIATKGVLGSLPTWQRTPVLVLDQFEEFLREAGNNYEQIAGLFRWVQHVTRTHATTMKVLLSLRSDSYTRVRPLERLVRAHSFSVIELSPMRDESAVLAICNGTYAPMYQEGVTVEKSISKRLFEQWQAQRTASSMFELQAKLYGLYWLAAERLRGERGTSNKVVIDQSVWDQMSSSSTASETISAAFGATFKYKLQHCHDAFHLAAHQSDSPNPASHLPVDVLTSLAEEHIRLMAPHLSTGSFKERRTLWDLFELSHSRKLETLLGHPGDRSDTTPFTPAKLTVEQGGAGGRGGDVASVMRLLWFGPTAQPHQPSGQGVLPPSPYLLSSTADEVLAHVGAPLTPLTNHSHIMNTFAIDHLPWLEDPDELSGGAMLGCQPAEVAIQLIRSYLLAVSWLDRSHICRVSAESMHLVHDQLGVALKTWADTLIANPMPPLASITAVVGDRFHWDMPTAHPTETHHSHRGWVEAQGGPYIINSRVQRSLIDQVHFRNTTFVNCDFRMTRFRDCAFENVQFVNCVLDGVLLDGCAVIGIPDKERTILPATLSRSALTYIYDHAGAPEFWADDAMDSLAALTYFRSTPAPADPVLYSLMSGVAAICVERSQVVKPDSKGKIPRLAGGLTILGGRITGLTVRDCGFKPTKSGAQGEMAIAFAAGSSVDFVEQSDLRLYMHGCAIRGFSVSRRLTDLSSETNRTLSPDAILIDARDCQLAGPWFSRGLCGSIELDDGCSVWGEGVLSPKEDFQTPGLLTEEELNAKLQIDSWRIEREDKRRLLPDKTDYRSRAAEYELQKRIDAGQNARTL